MHTLVAFKSKLSNFSSLSNIYKQKIAQLNKLLLKILMQINHQKSNAREPCTIAVPMESFQTRTVKNEELSQNGHKTK